MIRSAFLIAISVAVLSGCSGPIETRVTTHSVAPLPQPEKYGFGDVSDQSNEHYETARNLVGAALKRKGLQMADDAPMLVDIGLAERPASISVSVGEDSDTAIVAAQKEKKPLQSCDDKEHRLTVSIVDRATGQMVYSGTAAEYHCKGTISDSLPHLVRGAMSDFGNAPNSDVENFIRTRAGVE
ncbi:DUF4136 domain-containing protein [Parasphingorhabdus sp.]|uniref:DUF4136 domain-containing protein n=1 Tax=Parasphingorhabdus sp. TaxID=2709688 RepID=UPI003263181E